jgi:hypothetical protein
MPFARADLAVAVMAVPSGDVFLSDDNGRWRVPGVGRERFRSCPLFVR